MLQDYPKKEILILHTRSTTEREKFQKKITWINFSGKFSTINIQTSHQRKEPGIQSESIAQKYKIGLILGGQKPIQLVTYGDKIGFP